jgi:hypothetical protein
MAIQMSGTIGALVVSGLLNHKAPKARRHTKKNKLVL